MEVHPIPISTTASRCTEGEAGETFTRVSMSHCHSRSCHHAAGFPTERVTCVEATRRPRPACCCPYNYFRKVNSFSTTVVLMMHDRKLKTWLNEMCSCFLLYSCRPAIAGFQSECTTNVVWRWRRPCGSADTRKRKGTSGMKTYRKRKEQELVNAITRIMLLSLSLAVINPKTRTRSKVLLFLMES